jgi:hypothetical protein
MSLSRALDPSLGLVLYDFAATETRMVSLKKGKPVRVTFNSPTSEWVQVVYEGKRGFAPKTYIEYVHSHFFLTISTGNEVTQKGTWPSKKESPTIKRALKQAFEAPAAPTPKPTVLSHFFELMKKLPGNPMGLFEFVDEDISIAKPKKTGPKVNQSPRISDKFAQGLFDLDDEDPKAPSSTWASLQEGTIPVRKVAVINITSNVLGHNGRRYTRCSSI